MKITPTITAKIPRLLVVLQSILKAYAPRIAAAVPKISGRTHNAMKAQSNPILAYNPDLLRCDGKYVG